VNSKKTKRLSNKKIAILALLFLLLAAAGVATFALQKSDENAEAPTEQINLNPPSETDKKEAEQKKEELSKDIPSETETEQAANSTNANVIVTSWGQSATNFELAARVTNRLEDGGTCTLTLTKGTTTVNGTSTASTNVSDTSCGFIKIPLSKLSSGTWNATVKYSSSGATGTSSNTEVTVQ
jgi:hypothetical protein